MNYPDVAKQVKTALDGAKRIVVMQAGNPDGDSLSSALALETLLGQMGKDVVLYCAIDMPTHLRYLDGWDRVQKTFRRSLTWRLLSTVVIGDYLVSSRRIMVAGICLKTS